MHRVSHMSPHFAARTARRCQRAHLFGDVLKDYRAMACELPTAFDGNYNIMHVFGGTLPGLTGKPKGTSPWRDPSILRQTRFRSARNPKFASLGGPALMFMTEPQPTGWFLWAALRSPAKSE